MPRAPRPRWDRKRRRWVMNCGEPGADGRAREVFAPESIGPRDEPGAWDHFREILRRREARVAPTSEVTSEWIAEHYLAWAEARVAEGRMAAAHYANKCRHLGLWCDALGGRPARTLSAEDATAFASRLRSGGYAPSYVKNTLASVVAAFNWAVRARHLEANPIRGFESVTVPRSPERFAERAEAAAFLRHWRNRAAGMGPARFRWERMTILLERALIRTGARPKELCRLRWEDIRWEGWTSGAGHVAAKVVLAEHKTAEATGKPRQIYLTPVLTRALRRLRSQPWAHPEHVFVHGPGRGGSGGSAPWESGSRLSKTVLKVRRELLTRQAELRRRIDAGDDQVKPWERRLAAVNIQDSGHQRLVNYRWRHTAISTLLMLGVDVPTVAELTGTSPEMIYKVYGHLLDAHLAAAAEKLGRSKRKPPS